MSNSNSSQEGTPRAPRFIATTAFGRCASSWSITRQPASAVYVPGEPVTSSVDAGGTQPLSYQWLAEHADGWGDVAGETSPVLVVPTRPGVAVPAQRVVVTNSAGIAVSAPASVTAATGRIEITEPAPGARYHPASPAPPSST